MRSHYRLHTKSLLEDARRGEFEVVVAEALDRLSRDQEDVAHLFKWLGFASIRLVTLAEGEINELHVGLKGTMNAMYLKDHAEKTRRGLEGRVREGRSVGGLCFGYIIVRERDPAGEPVHGGVGSMGPRPPQCGGSLSSSRLGNRLALLPSCLIEREF